MKTMKEISSKELVLKLSGQVVNTDIYEFEKSANIVLSEINTTLVTDEDFAEAKNNVKACKKVETFISVSLKEALDEMKEVKEVTDIAEGLKVKFANTRLMLNKLVVSEETKRKFEITNKGINTVKEYLLKSDVNHAISVDVTAINNAIKNKRLIEKMQEGVDIEVETQIEKIKILETMYQENLLSIHNTEKDFPGLFPDFKKLCVSSVEVVEAQIESRVNKHKFDLQQLAEAKRIKEEKAAEALREKKAIAEKVVVPEENTEPNAGTVVFGGFSEPVKKDIQEAPVFGDVGVFQEASIPVVKKSYRLTLEQITTIYNSGYASGNDHTVEELFTHIASEDVDTYQSDVVEELIEELLGE
jgi:hypothetical protein